MKFISVSEAALDSIQRMGEADKAEIENLRWTLDYIGGVIGNASTPGESEKFGLIRNVINLASRVNHYSQTIARE